MYTDDDEPRGSTSTHRHKMRKTPRRALLHAAPTHCPSARCGGADPLQKPFFSLSLCTTTTTRPLIFPPVRQTTVCVYLALLSLLSNKKKK